MLLRASLPSQLTRSSHDLNPHPQPSALSPQLSALSPQPSALSPQPSALSSQTSALSPQTHLQLRQTTIPADKILTRPQPPLVAVHVAVALAVGPMLS